MQAHGVGSPSSLPITVFAMREPMALPVCAIAGEGSKAKQRAGRLDTGPAEGPAARTRKRMRLSMHLQPVGAGAAKARPLQLLAGALVAGAMLTLIVQCSNASSCMCYPGIDVNACFRVRYANTQLF